MEAGRSWGQKELEASGQSVCRTPQARPPPHPRACVPQLCTQRRRLSLGLLLATPRPQEKKWPR